MWQWHNEATPCIFLLMYFLQLYNNKTMEMALYNIRPLVIFGVKRICKYGLTTCISSSCFTPWKENAWSASQTLLIPSIYSPGGTPIYKGRGCWWEILTRTPRGGTKILFCERGLIFFVTLRGTSSKTTLYLLSYFFLCLNTLITDSAKASAVNPVRMNTRTRRGTQ